MSLQKKNASGQCSLARTAGNHVEVKQPAQPTEQIRSDLILDLNVEFFFFFFARCHSLENCVIGRFY